MKAVFAAAVAILCTGAATAAIADGSGSDSGMPVIASDSAGSGDGWGVASSAGVTYAASSASAKGGPIDAADQGVQQNYQFLDANVVEYTQLVSGGEVMTLSGVMLQRDGDDADAAELDEEASGVYSSGSAVPVPTLYDAVATATVGAGRGSQCESICGLVAGASGSQTSTDSTTTSPFTSSSNAAGPAAFGGFFPIAAPGDRYVGPGVLFPPLPPPIILPQPDPGSAGGGPPLSQPPGLNPGPVTGVGSVLAVPEPAVWTMMLLGFGAIGVARRRVRRTSHTA